MDTDIDRDTSISEARICTLVHLRVCTDVECIYLYLRVEYDSRGIRAVGSRRRRRGFVQECVLYSG